MQQLKLKNETIFRKKKIRSLKVYNLFWSLTSNKCQKNQPKTCVIVYCIVKSSENANIDDIIMMFLPLHMNNYATYLLAHSHALSTMSELIKSRKLF